MKTEFTVDKEFINEAYNSACSDWKLKIKNKFPDAFESELEFGKWYKAPQTYNIIFLVSRTEYYGLISNEWTVYNSESINFDGLILATDKEVETALIEEAKRRGFKEYKTTNWVDLDLNRIRVKSEFYFEYLEFDSEYNWLCDGYGNVIFKNGKWAEITNKPLTLEQRVEQLEKQLLCK